MAKAGLPQKLPGASLLILSSLALVIANSEHFEQGGHKGRELLATTSVTIGVTVPASCAVSPYTDLTTKNAAGYRSTCAGANSVAVPCAVTSSDGNAALNYTVNQGDTLAVTFAGASTSYVFMGGSLNDGFTNGQPCFTTATTASVATGPGANSITSVTDTGFTFHPTTAVCSQFYNGTIGTLNVLAFDASKYVYDSTKNVYRAATCKFNVGVIINPNAQSMLSPDQLFPLADGAAPLPGSMLQMLGMALLGAIVMLVMLQ